MESTQEKYDPENIITELKKVCRPGTDSLTLDSFIDIALYHPTQGYYNRNKTRVGRQEDTDFYTSSSMGKTFSSLVVESIVQRLPSNPKEFVFVELGPESEHGILANLDSHPFHSVRLIRPGDPTKLPEKSIVFSNELFDAQPFRRLVFQCSKWHEMGVRIGESGPEWTVLDLEDVPQQMPNSAPEGYVIDWPGRAHDLFSEIADQKWTGLFVAFDYGLDSTTIFNDRPQGTGRSYSNHKMGSDLLERPGEIDLTCHIIWDIMEQILLSRRFADIQLLRQESYFMNYAQKEIQRILQDSPPGFSIAKQSLMELIHPGNMGHQFHVLTAHRMDF